jgi:hypothetical protein
VQRNMLPTACNVRQVSSLKSHWAEILVARRVEQVEGEPLVLQAHHREETEMPRSRSTAIQSERTRSLRAPSLRPPVGSPRRTAAVP